MDIQADIDYGKIASKCNKAIDKAQLWLDNEVIMDSDPYVPFLTGDLSKSPRKVGNAIGSGEIEYNEPYAQRLYYGEDFNFTKSFHPLAGPFWFDKAKATNQTKWINGVQKIIKQEV
ncbi:MAG: minor capsid protein [Acinetobacter sp.]